MRPRWRFSIFCGAGGILPGMATGERTCPECKVALRRIKLLDHQGGATARVGFAYLLEGAPKMGMWKAEVKNRDGDVQGYLCEQCARILLYAEPL